MFQNLSSSVLFLYPIVGTRQCKITLSGSQSFIPAEQQSIQVPKNHFTRYIITQKSLSLKSLTSEIVITPKINCILT